MMLPDDRPVPTEYHRSPGEQMPIDTHPVNTSTTATDTTEACPYCGTTSGVQPMPAPPKVQAWKCTRGTDWAISVSRPDSRAAALLGDLGATAEAVGRLRWTLRQLCALADDAPLAGRTRLA
jgi:hypothetical protein